MDYSRRDLENLLRRNSDNVRKLNLKAMHGRSPFSITSGHLYRIFNNNKFKALIRGMHKYSVETGFSVHQNMTRKDYRISRLVKGEDFSVNFVSGEDVENLDAPMAHYPGFGRYLLLEVHSHPTEMCLPSLGLESGRYTGDLVLLMNQRETIREDFDIDIPPIMCIRPTFQDNKLVKLLLVQEKAKGIIPFDLVVTRLDDTSSYSPPEKVASLLEDTGFYNAAGLTLTRKGYNFKSPDFFAKFAFVPQLLRKG